MSQSLKQLWKHSSSLIILGKSAEATKLSNNFNYKVSDTHNRLQNVISLSVFFLFRINLNNFVKVLVLERPSKASYPGALVFPGGVAEQSDQAEDWLKFYRKFGIDDTKFKSIIKTCSKRSFIFNHDSSDSISR